MIRGLGEEVKEYIIFQKVLRSFPMIFNAKILAIEEMVDLNNLKMDRLLGVLTTYEMRVGRENSEPKKAMFKVSKKAKKHKYQEEHSNCESD